jgi:ubiquinone biosynthesis monooxygenase Coq7
MSSRHLSLVDRAIGEIHHAINTLAAPARAARAAPDAAGDAVLPEAQRALSVRLMRVNHAGEVAAQALYQGQALTSSDPQVATDLRRAAREETDHLAWCEQRLRELSGRTSLLNPLWYTGSFALGALAGALGRGKGLGFVAETEQQVEAHLREHMNRLAGADDRSIAILEQMTHDEVEHGAHATELGGESLPPAIAAAMRVTARLMTRGSYWL